jgi:hypothetical protein
MLHDTTVAPVIALVAASVIAALVRAELGVVVALASALWLWLRPHDAEDEDEAPATASAPPKRRRKRAACRAPLAAELSPMVRRPHDSIAEALPSAPHQEHVLDEALTRQKLMRGVSTEHTFHTEALPRAIAARAKELPNFDPAIRMLDAPAACTRPLGRI